MDVTMTLRSEGEAAEPRQRSRTDQRRSLWSGLDQATLMSNELLAALFTWSAIGWLLDRWLGTGPWLLVAGALIGNAAGLYLVYLRSSRMEGYDTLPGWRVAARRGSRASDEPADATTEGDTTTRDVSTSTTDVSTSTTDPTTDRELTTPERGRA
jgi:F0F1-type ATP synthase assembly protein I